MESSASTLALFGTSQKECHNPLHLYKSLLDLYMDFGEPPTDTEGLYFAIQTILYGKSILYFRVQEEGEGREEYLEGLHLLRNLSSTQLRIDALFLPKVSAHEIIDEGLAICKNHHGLLLMKEADFYDWATDWHYANPS